MYSKELNKIWFPHIIPSAMLGGTKHNFNNINGGMTRLADLNIVQSTFFGGNVLQLGWIKEYGFYAIPSMYDNEILGFYVHNPERITELGRKLLILRFPDKELSFEPFEAHIKTAEEVLAEQQAKKEFLANGVEPEIVKSSTVKELESLMRMRNSYGVKTDAIQADPPNVSPAVDTPVVHTRKILEKQKQPVGRK